MNKIINELLNTNARVIIPDFGAFIIKQKNPRLVVFNEFLRYNDGLLIDYIAASEKIEKSAAKLKVSNFVDDINKKLAQGDDVVIEGLGTLTRDDTGKMLFSELGADLKPSKEKIKKPAEKKDVTEPLKAKTEEKKEVQTEEKEKDKPESKEKDKITEKKEEVKPEPKKEEKITEKKEDAKPETKKEDKIAEKKEEVKPEPKKEDKIAEKKEEVKPETKKEDKKETKSKEEEPVEITLEKEETKPVPPKHEEKISVKPVQSTDIRAESSQPRQTVPLEKKPVVRTKRKNNSMQIIGWIILIVIVNGAIVAWFLFNDQITGIFKRDRFKETQMTTTVESDEDIPAVEQVTVETDESADIQGEEIPPQEMEQDNDVSDIPPASQPVMHDKKQYYIVAGCFREESNADQLVIELREKGFQSEKFGKIGNLHAVSFSSFADKSAALEELKRIRNTEQKEAWIAYY